APSMGFQGMR
uniref:Tachykinin-related peptide 9 n=1 Tax=Rhyparobia maderae TaxID=36963 RepID=TRP9_RHYMA|nr:RecName: Full=Tachykinin-related peptide 9; Short=LemTRP 9 [Rhyparobia maderae]